MTKRAYEIDVHIAAARTLIIAVEEAETPEQTQQKAVRAIERALREGYWDNYAKMEQRGMAPPRPVERIIEGSIRIAAVRDVTKAEIGR